MLNEIILGLFATSLLFYIVIHIINLYKGCFKTLNKEEELELASGLSLSKNMINDEYMGDAIEKSSKNKNLKRKKRFFEEKNSSKKEIPDRKNKCENRPKTQRNTRYTSYEEYSRYNNISR